MLVIISVCPVQTSTVINIRMLPGHDRFFFLIQNNQSFLKTKEI